MLTNEEIYARLVAMSQEIVRLAEEVRSREEMAEPSARVLKRVARKVKANECLQCGRTYERTRDAEVPYGGKGLCEECYQHTRYRLSRKKDVTKRQLIEDGLLTPEKHYSGNKTPRQIAEEILANANKAPRRGGRKKK